MGIKNERSDSLILLFFLFPPVSTYAVYGWMCGIEKQRKLLIYFSESTCVVVYGLDEMVVTEYREHGTLQFRDIR